MIISIICTIICWHNLDEELQHGRSLQMFCLSWFCVFSGLPALYDSPVICTKYLYFDTNLKSMFKTFKCWVSKIHICIQIQKNKQTFPRLDLHYAVPVSPLPSSAPPSHLPRSPGEKCVFLALLWEQCSRCPNVLRYIDDDVSHPIKLVWVFLTVLYVPRCSKKSKKSKKSRKSKNLTNSKKI